MATIPTLAGAMVLLTLAAPAFAQGRGPGSRQPSEGGAGGRDGVSHVGGAVPRHGTRPDPAAPPRSTLWSENASTPRSPFARGLVGGGLITPRPGVDVFRARPDTYAPGTNTWSGRPGQGRGPRQPRRNWAMTSPLVGGLYVPIYPYGMYPVGAGAPTASAADTPPPQTPTGFLRLVVAPRRAEVFVDGIYEGTVDDFGGTGERALPSGVHRIRLDTEGYEPVEFDVRIPDNDTITLRREMYPLSAPAVAPSAPAAPPAVPRTIYVIPLCYLGDTPPLPQQLPGGCSIANLRTLP